MYVVVRLSKSDSCLHANHNQYSLWFTKKNTQQKYRISKRFKTLSYSKQLDLTLQSKTITMQGRCQYVKFVAAMFNEKLMYHSMVLSVI